MAERRYEYRVRWQREGRNRTSEIRQTEAGAKAKVQRLLDTEQLKRGNTEVAWGYPEDPDYFIERFGDMPDLVGPPELQRREVGEWEPMPHV